MKRLLSILVFALLAAAIVLRVAFFEISVKNVPASSDESIMALQAKRITTELRTPLLMMAQPYLFPLEAYLAAPVIRLLPKTAFGARVVPALMGLFSVALSLMVCRRWGKLRDLWPAMLLVLFASPYLLMLQVAYALPGYPSFLLLAPLAVFLAQDTRGTGKRSVFIPAAAGFAAGLACSVTLLSAPVLALAGAMVCLGWSARRALVSAPAFVVGAAAGLLPHVAAKVIFPGAYAAVSDTYAWGDAIARLREPALSFTLPVAMGARFCLFPDNKDTLFLVPGADRAFAALWVALMLAATAMCAWRFVRRAMRDRWPSLEAGDVFVGISWLCVILFALNRRADGHAYRYLLPAVWAFPFVVAVVYARSFKVVRVALGAVAIALAALNAASAVRLMEAWRVPGFAKDEASLFDVRPAIGCLDAQGITRCYASYHVAYRITYATDERIVCGQYYNERFYGWPLPYKDMVDAASQVAFVLPDAFTLRPDQFDADLEATGVRARREVCGDFAVYSDFAPETRLEFPRLRVGDLAATAAANAGGAPALHDGNPFSRWRAHAEQEPGMHVEVALPGETRIAGVALYYNAWYQDRARSLDILARTGGRWEPVRLGVPQDMDRFEFVNGHPVLGNQVQTIRFEAVTADAIRVAVAEPEPGRDWAIGEIEVLVGDR